MQSNIYFLSCSSQLKTSFSVSLIFISREKEAIAKGEFIFEDGKVPSDVKKKEILKRIHEWERFEANCQMLKDLEKEKKKLVEQLKKNKRRKSLGNSSREHLEKAPGSRETRMRKAKSVGYPDQLSP